MSDHASPMNDQMKIWIRTWSTYCPTPPVRKSGAARSTAPTATAAARPARDAARRHPRLARMPPGRTNIITMKTTKAMT